MGYTNKDHHIGRVGFVAIALLFIGPLLTAQTDVTLRVTADNAKALIKPDASSELVREFPLGALLQSTARVGDWYQISFTNEAGYTILAYVSAGDVEVLGETVPQQPERTRARTPVPVAESSTTFSESLPSGFFLKAGVTDKGYGDWICSLGFDVRLMRNVTLGTELLPTFYKITLEADDFEQTTFPVHAFVNLKAGTPLSVLDPKLSFLNLYGGLGGGMNLVYTSGSNQGTSFSEFKARPALHVLGGMELEAGAVNLIFEYQLIRVLNPDIDPDAWVGYLLFGIRL